MSLDRMPTEVIIQIFNNLEAKDLARCRGICRRCRDIVDGFSDNVWKTYCYNDHGCVDTVYRKSKLSWRALYQSLSLWSSINTASMTVTRLPVTTAKSFQAIGKSIIGVRENYSYDIVNVLWSYSDTIVYYNVETTNEVSRLRVGFNFTSYQENEYLICVVDTEGRLCVITKEDKKRHFLGELAQYESGREYILLDRVVFYQTVKDKLCLSSMKRNADRSIYMDTVELQEFKHRVLSIVVKNKTLLLLSEYITRGLIYKFRHNRFVPIRYVDGLDEHAIQDVLLSYGFDWADPKISKWLLRTVHANKLNMPDDFSSACRFGSTTVLANTHKMIKMYSNLYNYNGYMNLNAATPNRVIYMNYIEPHAPARKHIEQLDIIEAANGHKVIVLIIDQVFVIDMLHDRQGGDVEDGRVYSAIADYARSVDDQNKTRWEKLLTDMCTPSCLAKSSSTPSKRTAVKKSSRKTSKRTKKSSKKTSNKPSTSRARKITKVTKPRETREAIAKSHRYPTRSTTKM